MSHTQHMIHINISTYSLKNSKSTDLDFLEHKLNQMNAFNIPLRLYPYPTTSLSHPYTSLSHPYTLIPQHCLKNSTCWPCSVLCASCFIFRFLKYLRLQLEQQFTNNLIIYSVWYTAISVKWTFIDGNSSK